MPLYPNTAVQESLVNQGYSFLAANKYMLNEQQGSMLSLFIRDWENLPPDNYLKYVDDSFSGSSVPAYRFRRWGQFLFETQYQSLRPLPYNPFTQYKVASKIDREIAPWLPHMYRNELLHQFIREDFNTYRQIMPFHDFYTVNVHLIRVADGNPSPEGKHQDDVYFFSVRLINLVNSIGGEAEIYGLDAELLLEKIALVNTLDTYFVNDRMLFHKGNKIIRNNPASQASRDVLIISFLPPVNL